jgi:hypothetical protein
VNIGNGLFKSGIWENGIWNNGYRSNGFINEPDYYLFSNIVGLVIIAHDLDSRLPLLADVSQ